MATLTATTRRRLVAAAASIAMLAVPARGLAQDAVYTLVDLGTLGGSAKRGARHQSRRAGRRIG